MFSQIPLSVRYMTLSAFGFAMMGAFVKTASLRGIPLMEIVAARALVSLILSYLDLKRKRLPLFGHRKGLLIARGTIGAFALICVYYSVTVIPLAEATVLQYLHPMFTAILAIVFLKETLQHSTLLCIGLSFLGLVAIARPDFLFGLQDKDYSSFALGIAILGAFGSAVAYVLVRKLSATEDPSVIIFYFPFVALPISLLLSRFLPGEDFIVPGLQDCIGLILIGIFTQIGQIGLTKAMQTETASKATAFSYLQVIFSALIGWYAFSEIPGFWTWVGGGLIIAGALINIAWKR